MRADDKKSDNLSCDGDPVAVSDRQYQQQAGDVLESRHLEIVRLFAGTGSLNVSVCNAQLRVRTKPDAKDLKLSVELGDKVEKPAADYIHILRVDPESATIHLKFPNNSHAIVTLTLPMNKGLESEFNLGRGDLNFDAIGSAGEREINVGYGHAKLLVDGDKSYADMQVNIGMGSLHDHRPGGHDGHFVVSKSYSGSGVGSLEVNVGMGSLDIAQE
ncbi:hypothetical protein H7849_17720 [Alloacidobacterium dinghuense]|uniref:Uncharacterized protein n=1 Tax=Alloacidobacterium dinghuense TaxID=2763107 RepID=A0A7G8BEG9_9BACT|nr:hypothetical protein [Alloacidobacterium dinghuense]QNI30939.1 hypothetical protein H7849_17720 [Alloacidobacterium dinghuense]